MRIGSGACRARPSACFRKNCGVERPTAHGVKKDIWEGTDAHLSYCPERHGRRPDCHFCPSGRYVVGDSDLRRAGGTLTAVTGADPTTLDPHLALSVADMAFREAVYENLTQLQHDLTLRPALAESWEPNEDLTSWIFHLRKGVKFHHGKTLTA